MHYTHLLYPFLSLCIPTHLDYVSAVFSHQVHDKSYSENK